MKKLLTLIIALGCSIAYAQPKFTPGLRGGVNFSKISDTDLGFKPDFYAGVFTGVKFNKYYTLQPEFGYSRQGAKGDFDYQSGGQTVSEDIDISLQYFTVAIINKITFVDRVSILVGPTVDFLVYNSDNVSVNNYTDVGLTLGLGCRLVDGLELEFRVKKGFVSTIDDDIFTDSTAFLEFDQTSNLALQLGLSYTFNSRPSSK
ncbi:porin family protein [Flavobacterium selenitireducens]|uniref:porin family protein n=1 Tax=Flavobacterium selenitireducens TaxID=2722704 RepID=UPI00168B58CA|nr:porin family protein [Flavobacterium selenitireducens]MBD3582176.1 PorT family protein [Flavobacterium selenitireducens]